QADLADAVPPPANEPGLMDLDRRYCEAEISDEQLEFLLNHFGQGLTAPRHTVLSAYVRKTYMHHYSRGTPNVRLRTACDLRERFPGIKRNYVGNAFVDVVVDFDYAEFQSMTIGGVARIIDQSIRQALSPDNIRENFQLTDDGIVPVNRSGKRGAGFDP